MSEGSRRGRWVVTLLVAAAATAGSTVPAWFRVTGSSALAGDVEVAVSGGQAAPAVLAAAVVLLAAAAAVGLVGRVGRWVVVAVVAAAGVVVLASVAGVLRDPDPVATVAVAAATGVTALAGPVSSTPWPWFACVLGVLDGLVALGLARASARWGATSRRHEPAASAATAGADDDRSTWDALTRGDDPTAG
ncbi:MAG TPA: Trp biosynthesis-associated membrane protein [Cellulomonas sp.]|uniref:Trp biosynthesis-associated membrane protein n=1 Tax=Cellulomonas sp. TaxID=40001 RepID=UPI002E3124F9|nr:Trp biosynthesis-associated membrane protein [Cellulomonas sp.]HEX5331779.1 Trp biosynthesis-associated membrane protein [Cellulomonas sp.]